MIYAWRMPAQCFGHLYNHHVLVPFLKSKSGFEQATLTKN